jgi:hypothetical protein
MSKVAIAVADNCKKYIALLKALNARPDRDYDLEIIKMALFL